MRRGDRALYYWLYPNFMINWYEGVMDTNLVLPLGVDRTEVIFDFYFADVSPEARASATAPSIDVGQRIQDEDTAICESVQRGLALARLPRGAALGPPRGGRAPLPPAARRRPEGGPFYGVVGPGSPCFHSAISSVRRCVMPSAGSGRLTQ